MVGFQTNRPTNSLERGWQQLERWSQGGLFFGSINRHEDGLLSTSPGSSYGVYCTQDTGRLTKYSSHLLALPQKHLIKYVFSFSYGENFLPTGSIVGVSPDLGYTVAIR
jgi:hypothetical protein